MSIEGIEEGHYLVIVDYNQSLQEMIDAGHYDYDWVGATWVAGSNNKYCEASLVDIEIVLIHLDREASTGEVEMELDKHSLRPATLPELLSLGAGYPDLQLNHPIVALGTVRTDDKGGPMVWKRPFFSEHYVVFLDEKDSKRCLREKCYGGWSDNCRFAAVRKS